MTEFSATIGETIEELHRALRDYIEATYHIGHPTLVKLRRELLERAGVIYQEPYLESTPRYQAGPRFRELGLHAAVLDLLSSVSRPSGGLPRLIFDPPYQHQAPVVSVSHMFGSVTCGIGSPLR